MSTRSLPTPHEPYVDKGTGKINEVWYRYLQKNASQGSRRILTDEDNRTFYVATTGSDTQGDGSSGNPFATPQQAYDYIADNIDGGGDWVKIHIGNGTYTDQTTERTNIDSGATETAIMVMDRAIPGVSALIIEGESVGGVIFSGFGMLHNTDGFVRIRNIKFVGAASDDRAIFARGAGATIGIESGCEFGAYTGANSAHMHGYGPMIFKCFSDYTVSGGAQRHFFLEGGTGLDQESSTITITGTPTFAVWLHVNQQSYAGIISMTFTGAANGYHYIRENGVIGTFPVADLNTLLPGSINGLERGPDNNTAPVAWTPALKFGGSSTGITYNVNVGYYTVIGSQVHLWATVNLSSKGAQTGSATVGGIPFNVGNYSAVLGAVGGLVLQNGNAPGGTFGTIYSLADASGTVIQMRNLTPAGADTAITDAEFNNNTTYYITISYLKD